MTRPALAMAAVLAAGAALGWWILDREAEDPRAPPRVGVTQVQPNPEVLTSRFVYDIVLHEPGQILDLLSRVEQLAGKAVVHEDDPGIALVLHGPEVGFFAKNNYGQYKDLVDRAGALDARGIIEIKVCETRMRALGYTAQDMPPFAELVPFGPDEVDRLQRRGYVLM
jgi:hypothetical protein